MYAYNYTDNSYFPHLWLSELISNGIELLSEPCPLHELFNYFALHQFWLDHVKERSDLS